MVSWHHSCMTGGINSGWKGNGKRKEAEWEEVLGWCWDTVCQVFVSCSFYPVCLEQEDVGRMEELLCVSALSRSLFLALSGHASIILPPGRDSSQINVNLQGRLYGSALSLFFFSLLFLSFFSPQKQVFLTRQTGWNLRIMPAEAAQENTHPLPQFNTIRW